MGQTLTNGIYLPDEGERNSYSGLEANWRTLDALILTVNDKAAPNVANTWTAAQTFTAGIAGDLTGNVTGNVTGDLTGTASRATADEDGTSIKTGYVNVAGNQTVSGQKTWSGNQFFTADVYHNHTSYESGNIPANNSASNIYLTDKNNVYLGYLRNVVYTSGRTSTEIRAKNSFKNGVLDPTGSVINSNLNIEVQPDGSKTLYFDGSIRNNVLPYTTNTYSLGSSSYQWSSVYAQTYYYNGTAWGLDKSNVWSAGNTFNQAVISNSSFWIASADLQAKNQSTLTSARLNKIGNESSDGKAFQKIEMRVDATYTDTAYCVNYYNTSGNIAYDFVIRQRVNSQGTKQFYPSVSDVADLGTSTNKWKSLNGINPGALSLPDYNNYIDVTSNIPVASLDGSTQINLNDYLADKTGWLSIVIADTAGNSITVTQGRAGGSTVFNNSRTFHTGAQSNGYISVFFPIIASMSKFAFIKASSLIQMRFYYCLGNV